MANLKLVMNAREFIKQRSELEVMKRYLQENPDQFEEMVSEIYNEDIEIAWRAAWITGHGLEKNDKRLIPHVDNLIELIPDKRDGLQREVLKLLMKMDLDDDQEGFLFDICMTIWEKVNKSPSVRMTAFQFIAKTVEKYTDLKHEISFITQSQYSETLSPGIRKSFERMVQKLF